MDLSKGDEFVLSVRVSDEDFQIEEHLKERSYYRNVIGTEYSKPKTVESKCIVVFPFIFYFIA